MAGKAQKILSVSLAASLDYLRSPQAIDSLKADLYWPKWNSPWWHALLLYEMGQVKLVPESIIAELVKGLQDFPCKIFPIEDSDLPPGLDPCSQTQCHCALGNIYQVLSAWGVEVDRELPWIRPWFLQYQMADGGLNCDNLAYRVKDECPSSMVATIAPFEAILLHTPRAWTVEEQDFLRRAAEFLVQRQLHLGSATRHNAEERVQAEQWIRLCFPRFYFYDVLRGLRALLIWARKTQTRLPNEATQAVLQQLEYLQELRPGRLAYANCATRLRRADGTWQRQPAASFPLLEEVSALDRPSLHLTRQWHEVRELLKPVSKPHSQ